MKKRMRRRNKTKLRSYQVRKDLILREKPSMITPWPTLKFRVDMVVLKSQEVAGKEP